MCLVYDPLVMQMQIVGGPERDHTHWLPDLGLKYGAHLVAGPDIVARAAWMDLPLFGTKSFPLPDLGRNRRQTGLAHPECECSWPLL